MLIDDVKIRVKAGSGGAGAVAFQKNMMSQGPTGTRGGRGGSVYAEGVSDISALRNFRYKKEISAESGGAGRSQFRDGKNGADLFIKVPVGTVIHNLDTGVSSEVTLIGERQLIAKGGAGGRGNFHFRGPENTSPKKAEPGKPGESFSIRLELKLIADVGFVGLPNAGKSSLLNALTNASAKVANYPFTTLEPNLGVHFDLVLADIPGLIEGAANGKGLGFKFLRHVERTKVLFHLVAADNPDVVAAYKTVRKELGDYNKALLEKPEYVFLSKSDLLSPAEHKKVILKLKSVSRSVRALSITDPESLNEVRSILNQIAVSKKLSTK